MINLPRKEKCCFCDEVKGNRGQHEKRYQQCPLCPGEEKGVMGPCTHHHHWSSESDHSKEGRILEVIPEIREYVEKLGGVKESIRKQYIAAMLWILHWYEYQNMGKEHFVVNKMLMVFFKHFCPLVSIAPYSMNAGLAISTQVNEFKVYLQFCRLVCTSECSYQRLKRLKAIDVLASYSTASTHNYLELPMEC